MRVGDKTWQILAITTLVTAARCADTTGLRRAMTPMRRNRTRVWRKKDYTEREHARLSLEKNESRNLFRASVLLRCRQRCARVNLFFFIYNSFPLFSMFTIWEMYCFYISVIKLMLNEARIHGRVTFIQSHSIVMLQINFYVLIYIRKMCYEFGSMLI